MQIPFALSLSKYLNSAGGDAGFASLLAVALLVILYFAHARETKTLRERLSEAHDRIDALESRLAQLIQMQSVRPQQPPPVQRPVVARPPAAAAAMGSAVASLRQAAPAAGGAANGATPVAPHGVGAPALMSATNALPESRTAPSVKVVAPAATNSDQDTMLVGPGATEVTGNGADRTRPVPVAVPVAAAAATAVGRSAPRPADGAPPRVQIRPEAPSGTVPRRPGQPPRGSLLDEDDHGPNRIRRVLGVLGALVAIVVIVVVLTRLTSNSTPTPSNSSHTSTKSSGSKSTAFNAHDVIVAVLNGTSVSGLAKDVSQALVKQGYRPGNITNAAVQTQKSTIVYYVPHFEAAAQHVAKALKLKPSSVQLANQSVIQSCAATPSSGAGSCSGVVIVSVGADRANLASATQSG